MLNLNVWTKGKKCANRAQYGQRSSPLQPKALKQPIKHLDLYLTIGFIFNI